MRAIDADALLAKVEKIQPWDPYPSKYAQGIRYCMELVSFLIKDAPTIESSAQPEVIRCKECKHLHKWRSEESAKKFGQIYTCAKDVLNCPKPEDFCSRPERRQDG